jgi:hypothetical protein
MGTGVMVLHGPLSGAPPVTPEGIAAAANAAFSGGVPGTAGVSTVNTRSGDVVLSLTDIPGVASQAFVTAAILAAGTGGISSFNTRTGAVTLISGDVTTALGFAPQSSTLVATAVTVETNRALTAEGLLAPKTSPALLGTPTTPTPAPGTNTTQIASTAFVTAAVVSATTGVSSINTRTGAVTLALSDIPGAAPLASPTFTGVPAMPTAAPGTNTTQGASTAFVTAAVAAAPGAVPSVRTVAGTTDTLLSADAGNVVAYTSATAVTLTVPAGLPATFQTLLIQRGAGAITVTASGTTINNPDGSLVTAGQYSEVSLVATALNTYILGGRVTTTQLAITAVDATLTLTGSTLSVTPVVVSPAIGLNVQTGTTYTLVAADSGKIVTCNNAGAVTLTVPAGLGAGFECGILQLGAGQVTPTASGTTLHNKGGFTKTSGQYAMVSLVAYASDTFVLSGDAA